MTCKDVIARIDDLMPNSFSTMQKLRWIYTLDLLMEREIFSTHERGVLPELEKPYGLKEERELPLEEAYCDLYTDYLMAMMDMYNSDYGRYTNDMIRFNSRYAAYMDHYNRTHLPLEKGKIRL